MRFSIHFVVIAAGGAALALALGCGQPPEDEEAGSKMPSSSAPSGAIESQGVIRTTTLPANFPDDVPNHPEAQVVQSKATSDLALAISMIIKDDVSAVSSYYADTFASEGWTTDIRAMPEGTAIFADKGNRSAAVMISEGRRGAQVELILGQQ